MWHRCTEEFRKCILAAYTQASADSGAGLSAVHLLNAVRRTSVGEQLLSQVGITSGTASPCVETESGVAPLPTLDARVRTSRDLAYREAVYLGDDTVGPEHLLIGLAQTRGSVVGDFLNSHGATAPVLRRALFEVQPTRTVLPPDVTLDAKREKQRRQNARAKAWRDSKTLIMRRLGALTQIGSDPVILSHLLPRQRVNHPHGFFARLRKRGLYFSKVGNCYIGSRYDDIQQALRTPELSVRRYDRAMRGQSALPPFVDRQFNGLNAAMNRLMLFQDAPEQTRLRGLVSRQFTPRFITGMKAEIQAIAESLVDAVVARGEMDIIRDFAFPFPATVIARLLGVDEKDLLQFKAWSDDFVRLITFSNRFADDVRTHGSLDPLDEYFHRAIAAERQRLPSHTLLSLLTHAESEKGEKLTDDEITSNALLLLAAGHETTTHLIANGLRLLLTHPDALRRLQEDPSGLPTAIEEMLRFEPPVQWTTRIAKETVTLGNHTLRPGDVINVCLAAANRDPDRFAQPDTFDIARQDNRHLGFGSGPHFCLGAALARMEAEIAFITLLRRLPGLKLKNEKSDWRFDLAFRAQKTLPVLWTPPTAG